MQGKAIFSLVSGVTFVIVTLIAVGLLNPPLKADAAVRHGALVACPLAVVSVDTGYGVSSKVLEPICDTVQVSSSAR